MSDLHVTIRSIEIPGAAGIDIPEDRVIEACGVCQGYRELQNRIILCNTGRTTDVDEAWELEVFYHHVFDERDVDGWWGRFARTLQRCTETRLERLSFLRVLFNRAEVEHDATAIEFLFREVLPKHGSLTTIRFTDCIFPPVFLDLFATSLVRHHANHEPEKQLLRELSFSQTRIDPTSVAALAQLLCAKNGMNIQVLDFSQCSMDSASCEAIFLALDGNTSLRELDLSSNDVSDISMEAARAVGNAKNLCCLEISDNPWSEQSLRHLAKGFRLNVSLETLLVVCCEDQYHQQQLASADAFVELLQIFNYTLESVEGAFVSCVNVDVEQLLLQNKRIKRLDENLLKSRYQAPHLSSWPLVMENIGSKPSLIYRFLRHGNLESFSNQVLLTNNSKRKHSSVL